MSREDIEKLLGGYATDTLSEAERRALFEAALEDQDLFDALAREQALHDVLHDPCARQQLIAALSPPREPFAARAWRWLRRPAALTMAAGMAGLLIVAGLVLRQATRQPRRLAMVAEARIPQPAPPLAAPSIAVAPAVPQRKPFHPPAVHVARQAEPLPPPPPVPPAAPAPNGPVADAVDVKRQLLQAAQAASGGIMAQEERPMAAMVRAKAAPGIANPAVRYTLLLQDAGGAYAPAPSGSVFHAGDSVRLQVEPGAAGYIYLFRRAGASWDVLASQRVEKAQRYELPSTGALQSAVPARLELLLVLSRAEQPALDALTSSARDSLKITLEFR